MDETVEHVESPTYSEPTEGRKEVPGEAESPAVASDAEAEPDRGAAGIAPEESGKEGPGEEPETAVERDSSAVRPETAQEQKEGQPESEKLRPRAKANAEGLKAITEPQLNEWLSSSSAAAGSDEDWPEAVVAPPKAVQAGYASSPTAAPSAVLEGSRPSSSSQAASSSEALNEDASAPGCDNTLEVPAGGLRRFMADLAKQLEEEVRRRESEEAELERRAAEKKRLLEELDTQRKRREALLVEQKDDDRTATEIEKQHTELAEEHQRLRSEVARQETELEQLREEVKVRTGAGRDWARDGPEKDALVETKLRIAEAHDELAQMRQQLWMNREGLKKQLSDLQAENMRLRTGRSPLS